MTFFPFDSHRVLMIMPRAESCESGCETSCESDCETAEEGASPPCGWCDGLTPLRWRVVVAGILGECGAFLNGEYILARSTYEGDECSWYDVTNEGKAYLSFRTNYGAPEEEDVYILFTAKYGEGLISQGQWEHKIFSSQEDPCRYEGPLTLQSDLFDSPCGAEAILAGTVTVEPLFN